MFWLLYITLFIARTLCVDGADQVVYTSLRVINLLDKEVIFNYKDTDGLQKLVLQPDQMSVSDNVGFPGSKIDCTVNEIPYVVPIDFFSSTGNDILAIFPLKEDVIDVVRLQGLAKVSNLNTTTPYDPNYVFGFNTLPLPSRNLPPLQYFLKSEKCHNCNFQQLTPTTGNTPYFTDNSVGEKTLKVVAFDSEDSVVEVFEKASLRFDSRGGYLLLFIKSTNTWKIFTLVTPESYYTPIFIAIAYAIVVVIGRLIFVRLSDKIEADEYYSVKKNIQNTSGTSDYVVDERIVEADILRGVSIVLFIIVNCGGGGYIFFNETVWDGMKIGDLPELGIAWVTGFSAPFLIKYKSRLFKTSSSFVKFILVKSLILFGFGLSYTGNYVLSRFIYTGFFQRMGIALFINTLMAYFFPFVKPEQENEPTEKQVRRVAVRSLGMLILPLANVLISHLLPVPGCPTGYLRPGGIEFGGQYFYCTGGANRYIDRLVFGETKLRTGANCSSVYQCPSFDKYGILGTLNFIFGMYLAVLVGEGYLKFREARKRTVWVLSHCLAFLLVTTISIVTMEEYFLIPINRSVYSLSFVMLGSLFVEIFFILIRYGKKLLRYTGWPFCQVGFNGVAIMFMQEVCKDILPFGYLNDGNHQDQVICALMNVTIWVCFAIILDKYKFYIKI